MSKIQKTPMLKRYMLNLIIRVAIFISVFATYLLHKEWLVTLMMWSIFKGITPLHLLWLFFMVTMLFHLFPIKKIMTMALRKSQPDTYLPVAGYSELELYRFVQKQNTKAWEVMLVWLLFNSVWGGLYLLHILSESDLLMLTVFYFLCDYICILFYCPFQSIIMGNRCCVNCRIFDWGHFMMFTPMLFIKSFFSWSLFLMSLIVLIHWEISYTRHPERFWYGSNQRLMCANCRDKTCQFKKTLKNTVVRKKRVV